MDRRILLMSDSFTPVEARKVQEIGSGDTLHISIPKSTAENLDISAGDALAPVVQDGLLVFVPMGNI